MDDTNDQAQIKVQPELSGEVNDLFTIQTAIKTRIEQIEKAKEEIRPHKEMVDSYLENDPEYSEKVKLAKQASKEKSVVKARLLKQPEAAQLVDKIKALQEQMKDLQDGLSYYLREYQRLTGANEIEGSDGELRQIVYVARLVRKTNLNQS